MFQHNWAVFSVVSIIVGLILLVVADFAENNAISLVGALMTTPFIYLLWRGGRKAAGRE